MQLFAMLKRNTRLALRGSWGRAIAVLLAPAAVSLLLTLLGAGVNILLLGRIPQQSFTGLGDLFLSVPLPSFLLSILLSLANLLLTAPLRLGASFWFYSLVHGRSLPAREALRFFAGKKQYGKALWFQLHLYARSFLWALMFLLLPVTLTASSLLVLSQNGDRRTMAFGTVGLVIAVSLTLLAEILCAVHLNRYFLTPYLLCEQEDVKVGDAFRVSVQYSSGYRINFFLFTLSFVGWGLLCILTLGLGALYTAPYVCASCAMYGRYVTERNRYVPPEATREFVVE